jgi:hypothetical protein
MSQFAPFRLSACGFSTCFRFRVPPCRHMFDGGVETRRIPLQPFRSQQDPLNLPRFGGHLTRGENASRSPHGEASAAEVHVGI